MIRTAGLLPTRRGNRFAVSFDRNARVAFEGDVEEYWEVSFEDAESAEILYATVMRTGMWTQADPRYHVPWRIRFESLEDPSERYEYVLELAGRNVLVVNQSDTLGDAIAWVPYVAEFARRFGARVAYSTPFAELFAGAYPELRLLRAGEPPPPDASVRYDLGIDLDDPTGAQRNAYQSVPLQRIAADALGLPFEERRPRLSPELYVDAPSGERRYVCIATQSTAQAKYWVADGWQRVVEYLGSLGYEVRCVDRHPGFGTPEWWNTIPANCVDRTGERGIRETALEIAGSAFFIGLSSGLSWLAWALGRPVVLISGFTSPLYEFVTPYRVFNPDVCNSCWNDLNFRFVRKDWTWCPRQQHTPRMFECARGISFERVREKIDACLRELGA